ncbi:MAG: SynChlorMet cassette protein ScmC [Deltaproteobacteria bacterium]|nr:SynChlorMet cassette protein ScmC [Deltaproteobacteria bacterium]
MSKSEKTYSLNLAGGHSWNLMATADEMPLVKRIASMMELEGKAAGNSPRLIMTGGGSYKKSRGVPLGRLEAHMREGLPREGWRGRNCGSLRVWFHGEKEDVVYETFRDTKNYRELEHINLFLFPVYRKVFGFGGMTVHAALVEWKGAGMIIAAQSQTGKSTCCRRLPPPWKVLGDEEAIKIKDHQGGYLVHPFPTWSDYYDRKLKRSWDVGRHLPLRAVFFLEQADRVGVAPIGQAQAAVRLLNLAREKAEGSWWCVGPEESKALRKKLFFNACDLVTAIPTFVLRTNLTGRFWEAMENAVFETEEGHPSAGSWKGRNPATLWRGAWHEGE